MYHLEQYRTHEGTKKQKFEWVCGTHQSIMDKKLCWGMHSMSLCV